MWRLKYSRGEALRFVSHLDFVRVFERAARRGGIDVAFSGGFNPRIIMVFGNPLPVGVTSDCELMDITLNRPCEGSDLVNLFNSELPGGIKVLEAEPIDKKTPSILKSISTAEYIVMTESADCENPAVRLRECYDAAETLATMKKSKSGVRETDIKPLIREFTAVNGSLVRISCMTGIEGNLRPELAINALAEKCGICLKIGNIHKTKCF